MLSYVRVLYGTVEKEEGPEEEERWPEEEERWPEEQPSLNVKRHPRTPQHWRDQTVPASDDTVNTLPQNQP